MNISKPLFALGMIAMIFLPSMHSRAHEKHGTHCHQRYGKRYVAASQSIMTYDTRLLVGVRDKNQNSSIKVMGYQKSFNPNHKDKSVAWTISALSGQYYQPQGHPKKGDLMEYEIAVTFEKPYAKYVLCASKKPQLGLFKGDHVRNQSGDILTKDNYKYPEYK